MLENANKVSRKFKVLSHRARDVPVTGTPSSSVSSRIFFKAT
jgi:hypothetical protein